MVDFSTNPQNLMTITPSIVPRVARSWEPPGGGGGTTRPKLVAGSDGIVAKGETVPDSGGPCDLSPCSPFQHYDGRHKYILYGHSEHGSAAWMARVFQEVSITGGGS